MSLSNQPQLTSVVVAGGTGLLGKYMVNALLEEGSYQVKVLYRSESKPDAVHQQFESKGATMVPVDYNSVENLAEALQSVHVVVCTFGFAGLLENQLNLIEASQKAGVIKFVPSEFGVDGFAEKYPTFAAKAEIRKALEKSNLEYTYYNNGFFLEISLTDAYNLDLTKDRLKVIGNGDAPLSLTSMKDIADYVARTLTKPGTKNRVVNILGQTTSINKIINVAEGIRGRKYTVERIPESDIQNIPDLYAPENAAKYTLTIILLIINRGEVFIDENSFNPNLAGRDFKVLKVDQHIASILPKPTKKETCSQNKFNPIKLLGEALNKKHIH